MFVLFFVYCILKLALKNTSTDMFKVYENPIKKYLKNKFELSIDRLVRSCCFSL